MKTIVPALMLLAAVLPAAGDRPYLDAALQAARWIDNSKITARKGTVWPSDPKDPKSVHTRANITGSPCPIPHSDPDPGVMIETAIQRKIRHHHRLAFIVSYPSRLCRPIRRMACIEIESFSEPGRIA